MLLQPWKRYLEKYKACEQVQVDNDWLGESQEDNLVLVNVHCCGE